MSMSWYVVDGEVCAGVVSIGSGVDDMAVKCRVSHLSGGRCHVIYPPRPHRLYATMVDRSRPNQRVLCHVR